MKKLIIGTNDLATVRPDLASQWHPTKNGDLKPKDVAVGSNKLVWWFFPYDDPKTGKHFDFEWQATVNARRSGHDCPYLVNQAVWKGFNDLATINPELAKEWHPTKNGNLLPENVTSGTAKKVWWLLPYDDPATGKHFDFEWQATINSRSSGNKCPFLSNKAVWKGYNDLATLNPNLAREWHPTKNGNLLPSQVSRGSHKNVWWQLPYDDPKTGKHFVFEWQAIIKDRDSGNGCPILSGKVVWRGFNDLATINPMLASEWHPTKNGSLKPEGITAWSNKRVWWYLPYDDPNTGKHFDFEWQSSINCRSQGIGCPYLSGHAVWSGFNDLATTHPTLVKEWHPKRNNNITPQSVTAMSDKKVWWLLPYDDPKTGKHFDFEWEAPIKHRSRGKGCPYLSNRVVWKGFNDLATVYPELAQEWHPSKNDKMTPEDVTAGMPKRVWWYLPYDDPRTGKHFDFEWQANINDRASGCGCPYLVGKSVWQGYNDLATVNPKIAEEWHPTKNGTLTPRDVTSSSSKVVWWLHPYDDPRTGKHFDFEWKSSVDNKTSGEQRCPYLSGRAVWKGFNDLVTVNPNLAREWHPTKNGALKADDVTISSRKKVWWYLPYDDPKTGKHFDFEWQAYIYSRATGVGCPYLSESNGEKFVRKYFSMHGIPFEEQKKFEGLVGTGGASLSYDFCLKQVHVLVEYQGIQHYKAIEYFGGEQQLENQKEHDRRKRNYAKTKGYQLIEISYKYETEEEVFRYLDEHLTPLLNVDK